MTHQISSARKRKSDNSMAHQISNSTPNQIKHTKSERAHQIKKSTPNQKELTKLEIAHLFYIYLIFPLFHIQNDFLTIVME